MRKLPILFCLLVMVFSSSFAAPPFELEQLQGAWWSDPGNITADFGIDGDQVWLDSLYYRCRIEADMLIFELPDVGPLKKRIISLDGDRLVVEDEVTKERIVLTRVKS